MKYRFNGHHALRLAYANGYRAPSIKELYLDWSPTYGPITYNFNGNSDLVVESSHNFNVFYTYAQDLDNGKNVIIEPTLFYNLIDNLIGLSELEDFERHYIN